MNNLKDKNILLGITGSIAAYKIVELIRLLRAKKAHVKVVMTNEAKEFITVLTLQAISGQPVHTDLLDPATEASMSHISLARWADLFLVAPASANILAKFNAGIADDLLTTLYLACNAPVAIAPAMNQQMWRHYATQKNVMDLIQQGVLCWGPDHGNQACGDNGPGRMLEPDEILQSLIEFFSVKSDFPVHVLITAGPTREPIDPVRFISNYSSGKMGYALAQAAAQLGAITTLISGPTQLATPSKVRKISVETAQEMHAAVMEQVGDNDIFISAAAVADYCSATIAQQKIKKSTLPTLSLRRTPDILQEVGLLPKKPFLVGFAAESENLYENAKKKFIDKNLDLMIANLVDAKDLVFDSDFNQVLVIGSQAPIHFPRTSKIILARNLMKLIFESLLNK